VKWTLTMYNTPPCCYWHRLMKHGIDRPDQVAHGPVGR